MKTQDHFEIPERKSLIKNSRKKKKIEVFENLTQSAITIAREKNYYVPYFKISHSINEKVEYKLHVTLEYPGNIQPEMFLLLKPKYKNLKQNEIYDPIADLIRSIHLISENYLTAQQRRLSDGILLELEQCEINCSAEGFSRAVAKFNRVIKNLKEKKLIGKITRNIHGSRYELICHILFQVYSRTVAWRAEILNNYPPFSDQVYGEMFPPLVNEIIAKTNIDSSSVFMDLGCGIGNVVLQVAAQTGCEAYGVEIMPITCRLAKRQLKEYAARMRAWRLSTGKIRILEANFLEIVTQELSLVFMSCDVILVNNHSYTPATNHALVQLFSRLQEGTRIVSLSPFVPKNHNINKRTINMPESILEVEKFEYKTGWVSWTSNYGTFYISTVNRSRLESFLDESK